MNNILDINDIPLKEWQEVEASRLPHDVLISELQTRGYIVKDACVHDEVTGLLKFEGTEIYYLDPETRKVVPTSEAYKRASGGW